MTLLDTMSGARAYRGRAFRPERVEGALLRMLRVMRYAVRRRPLHQRRRGFLLPGRGCKLQSIRYGLVFKTFVPLNTRLKGLVGSVSRVIEKKECED